MTDSANIPALDSPPDAARITALREQAAEEGASVKVTFTGPDGDTKRFVVSPRGSCVVLQDMREESFNPSVSAEDVASALHD